MLALLVLAVVASASATPLQESKILPVYEYPLVSKIIDPTVALRSWCLDDCHHHVLDKPVFIMVKGQDGNMDMQYHPLGLNSLGQSPLKKELSSGKMVAMVTPVGRFPHFLLDNLNVTFPAVPEHSYKFSDMYKEAPIMLVVTDEEFKTLTKSGTKYIHLADFAVGDQGFSMYKEYALPKETGVVSKGHWLGDWFDSQSNVIW